MILILLILFASCQTSTHGFLPQPHQVFEGKASYIIDAETFYFSFDQGKVKVRIAQVNETSMSDKKGFQTYEYLRKHLLSQTVRVEFLNQDSQGRWIANVTLADGQSLQKILENQAGTP